MPEHTRRLTLVGQVWSLFDRRERWQLGVLSVAQIFRAFVELAGVASIMPFMSVVADPEIVHTNPYLAAMYTRLGFESAHAFLVALGVAVIIMLTLSNGTSALAHYGMVRFSWGMHHRLSVRLLSGYLAQPYSFFTSKNSASLNKTLLNECQVVIRDVVLPMMDVVARVLVIVALIVLLLITDPLLALTVALVLGGVYGIVYFGIKTKQRRLGLSRVQANHERFKVAGEAFGGIKDVKVLEREKAFIERYRPASGRFSRTTASNTVMQMLPKYLIETIAFGGIVLIVIYYLQAGHGVAQILPIISLYAFAGYRLMPQLQGLFADLTRIRFNRAALDDLLENYHRLAEPEDQPTAILPFETAIVFEDVVFAYEGSAAPALRGISLSIEKNQTVGLVGQSGSGKTTLVDLLLGLYEPTGGQILIDGEPLTTRNLSAWRRQVGYVPQHIFLTDDTIAANIAFGVQAKELDMERVERAACIAHLHDFIMTLPDGYQTLVGERGVRLSGGQRQRIGIARALYHDPEVLIMDEATSALDGATEEAVMQAIRDLAGQKTIVLIAHRLSTVEECDCICLLDSGRVVDVGTYEELAEGSEVFQAMAKLRPFHSAIS